MSTRDDLGQRPAMFKKMARCWNEQLDALSVAMKGGPAQGAGAIDLAVGDRDKKLDAFSVTKAGREEERLGFAGLGVGDGEID